MKILKNTLKNELNIRTQKDFPKKGIEFVDITPLILQKEVFQEITDRFVEEVKDKNVDYIVAPEARGFLFGTSVAYELGIGILPVRKKGKLPPVAILKSVTYEKEYGEDVLELTKLVNDTYEGKNFYIIDDIYATGNTMKVIQEGIEELGGKVVGKATVMNIVELNNDKDVFSLIDINES